ncbi:MAG: YebC/PmpR family DNA-binding transcriptional regulator [Patescibacteria group bacterium]
MAGHSKWAQIKRAKGAADSARSKLFGKLGRFLAVASKKCRGDVNAPELRAAIEKAKKENMPKDTIERAIKKGVSVNSAEMESLTYEAYGAGGAALLIEVLTDNRNKATQEIKHILSKNGGSLGAKGSAMWAFEKTENSFEPSIMTSLSKEASSSLINLMEKLESNDEVQEVFTNAELQE